MAKAKYIIPMAATTQEIMSMTKEQVKAFMFRPMVIGMRDNGKTTSSMAKAEKILRMATTTLGIMPMTKEQVKAFMFGPMVIGMRVNGKTTSSTEKVHMFGDQTPNGQVTPTQ